MEDEIGAALEAGHFGTKNAELLARSATRAMRLRRLSCRNRVRESRRDASLRSGSAGAPVQHQLRADRPSRHDPATAGLEKVPFFLIRVDPAGNISKLLDGAELSICQTRRCVSAMVGSRGLQNATPDCHPVAGITPDGQRFFSIARTVTAGGGVWRNTRGARHRCRLRCRACRAVDLYPRWIGTAWMHHADRRRIPCLSPPKMRSAIKPLPIGRELLPDDFRRRAFVRVLRRLMNR